jgi:hypothetical protein
MILTDKDRDHILARFDRTEPQLQRQIVVTLLDNLVSLQMVYGCYWHDSPSEPRSFAGTAVACVPDGRA